MSWNNVELMTEREPVKPKGKSLKLVMNQSNVELRLTEHVKSKVDSLRLVQRKLNDRTRKAERRALGQPIETAIDSFVAKTKQGPDCVCTCCHRLSSIDRL